MASSSPPLPSPSLVARARTALNSAASKAEKVLTDIRADRKGERAAETDRRSIADSKRSPEQDVADTSNKPIELSGRDCTEEGAPESSNKLTIPPCNIIRQLAIAAECVKNFKSVEDLLTLDDDPLYNKEKTGLKFSVVKSLVLREKEDNSNSKFCEGEALPLLHRLFSSEECVAQERTEYFSTILPTTNMPNHIRGAPPDTFVVKLAEIVGGLKSMQKMASLWYCVVNQLRRLWLEGQAIPHIPLDSKPDLNTCLLHQQLQVINCCIARKRRKKAAIKSLDSIVEKSLDTIEWNGTMSKCSPAPIMYARIDTGEYVLRLGAVYPVDDLNMLETGEPIYCPVTQEGPVLTEEAIKETEEFVLRTRSVGAGCSQLLSDMQAFKAANPGCVLEDFIRWHSPPDWLETELQDDSCDLAGEDSVSIRGRLSRRMQKQGNLWHELWETAKSLPAVKQTPLFDEDLAVEGILTSLESIPPSHLFGQLLISILWSGFLIAEAAFKIDGHLSKVFCECKDYVTAAFQGGSWLKNITDICRVYETIETLLQHPLKVMILDQPEEAGCEEPKRRFKKVNLSFMGKDRCSQDKETFKAEEKEGKQPPHVLTHLFGKSTSLFSKKHSKPKDSKLSPGHSGVTCVEDDWTMV